MHAAMSIMKSPRATSRASILAGCPSVTRLSMPNVASIKPKIPSLLNFSLLNTNEKMSIITGGIAVDITAILKAVVVCAAE